MDQVDPLARSGAEAGHARPRQVTAPDLRFETDSGHRPIHGRVEESNLRPLSLLGYRPKIDEGLHRCGLGTRGWATACFGASLVRAGSLGPASRGHWQRPRCPSRPCRGVTLAVASAAATVNTDVRRSTRALTPRSAPKRYTGS
jgi:hypothetical protein